MLAERLEDLGHPKDSEAVIRFARENRDLLVDVEAAYMESRYGLATATKRALKAMVEVAKLLFALLEGVERHILG